MNGFDILAFFTGISAMWLLVMFPVCAVPEGFGWGYRNTTTALGVLVGLTGLFVHLG